MANTHCSQKITKGPPVPIKLSAISRLFLSQVGVGKRFHRIAGMCDLAGNIRQKIKIAKRYMPEMLITLEDCVKCNDPCGFLASFVSTIDKRNLLPIYWNGEIEGVDDPLFEYVPITPLGISWENFESYDKLFRTAALVKSIHSEEVRYLIDSDPLYPMFSCLGHWSPMQDMRGVFRKWKWRGPWRDLPNMYLFSIGQTGFDLLDISDDEYTQGGYSETWENFPSLVNLWRRCKPIYQSAFRLLHWINDDADRRIIELSNILKEVFNENFNKSFDSGRGASKARTDIGHLQ